MYVDYYLRGAPSTPVTIEFVGPQGAVLRRYSSADKPTLSTRRRKRSHRAGSLHRSRSTPIPARTVLCGISQRTTTADRLRHRNLYGAPVGERPNLHAQRGDRARIQRLAITDRALLDQYALATAIHGRLTSNPAARQRAQALLKSGKPSAGQAAHLRTILGIRGEGDPTTRSGNLPKDFTSLRFLNNSFTALFGAIEMAQRSADPLISASAQQASRTPDGTIAALAAIAGPN